MHIHNVPSLKPRRKELRATLTPAEIRLWQALQHRRLENLKFRRQHSIGPFIVDFYCPSAKLVVELDGSVHDSDTAWRRDQQRTAYLVNVGLSVVRFENRDVMENLEGVLSEIRQRARGWQEKPGNHPGNHPGASRHPSLKRRGKNRKPIPSPVNASGEEGAKQSPQERPVEPLHRSAPIQAIETCRGTLQRAPNDEMCIKPDKGSVGGNSITWIPLRSIRDIIRLVLSK